jgi:hypothetical protein
MANTVLGARSPRGNVGVRGVVDSGEVSAYTAGVLSGFAATGASSWTIDIGGSSGVQDVAIARNPAGESELLVGTAGQALDFTVGGAPGTPGQSRTDALVAYKDVTVVSSVNDAIDAVDFQVVAGTAATTGSQVPPNDATIRSAITNGSTAFVAVIGYVTVAHGASSVSTGNYVKNQATLIDNNVLEAGSIDSNKIDFTTSGGIWWEELGRTTLGSTNDNITVSGLSAKKYLKLIISSIASGGTVRHGIMFNGDAGNNYAWSRIDIQTTTANGTLTTTNLLSGSPVIASGEHGFGVAEIYNPATTPKFTTFEGISRGATVGTAPTKRTGTGIWYNTSVPITEVIINKADGSGTFGVGSGLIVLGHD